MSSDPEVSNMTKQIELFDIFDGFFITNGKKPIHKAGQRDKEHSMTIEQIREADPPSYCGLLKPNVILVDIDNESDGKFLLALVKKLNVYTRVHKTTHGYHFFFLIPRAIQSKFKDHTGWFNTIGIKFDFKCGFNGGVAVLKLNGVERECVHNNYSMCNLPLWLYAASQKEIPAFRKMGEGDGRNSALFSHILTLQRADFKKSEIKEIINFISANVLKTPLQDEELRTIMRDDAFKTKSELRESEKVNRGELMDKRTDEYIEFAKPKLINGQLHILDEDMPYYYTVDSNKLSHNADLWDKTILKKDFQEISWKAVSRLKESPKPPMSYLLCKNGIYDWSNDTLLPFDTDIAFVTPPINAEYDPNAYDETTDKVLAKISCGDSDLRLLLEEMIGACICWDNSKIRRLFILYGDGSNGKSVYIQMIQSLLGKHNYSSVKMQELAEDKFQAINLYGKLANFGDDISDRYLADSSLWKNIATGDSSIYGQKKGEQGFYFHPSATPIFSCNDIPKVHDTSGGWYRRATYIPFDAVFRETDPDFDPDILEKVTTQSALNYLFKLGIDGLKRVIKNRRTTTGDKVVALTNNVKMENDSFSAFVQDTGSKNIVHQYVNDVYIQYIGYCNLNGYRHPISKNRMGRRLYNEFKIVSRIVSGNHRMYFFEDEEVIN